MCQNLSKWSLAIEGCPKVTFRGIAATDVHITSDEGSVSRFISTWKLFQVLEEKMFEVVPHSWNVFIVSSTMCIHRTVDIKESCAINLEVANWKWRHYITIVDVLISPRGVTLYSKYIGNFYCSCLSHARFTCTFPECQGSLLNSIGFHYEGHPGLLGSAVMGLGYSYRDKSTHLHFPVV